MNETTKKSEREAERSAEVLPPTNTPENEVPDVRDVVYAEEYSNVLPPHYFREIENSFPGRGEALINEMIADRQHGREMEKAESRLEFQREQRLEQGQTIEGAIARRSQWFAFILAGSGLVTAVLLGVLGALWGSNGLFVLAGLIFSGTLGAIVLGFLNNGQTGESPPKPPSEKQNTIDG